MFPDFGSLIGDVPWCEVRLIGVVPWWWLVLELVAELLEIILVKGVVYCTTLGLCVLRVAGCGLPGALGEARCSTTGPEVSSLSGNCLKLNLTDRFYLFSAFPPFDGRGAEAGGF